MKHWTNSRASCATRALVAGLLLACTLARRTSASLIEEEFALITTQIHYPLIATDDNQIATHDAQYADATLDAPKYYHLNELLYKTTNGNESPQAAALPESMRPLMSPLRPMGMRARGYDDDDDDDAPMMAAVASGDDDDDDDDALPIDGLVRAMRARNGDAGESTARDATGNAIGTAHVPETTNGNRAVGQQDKPGVLRGHSNGAGPRSNSDEEDGATIQRKSTNLDDVADEPPARLTARDNIRRRRRRASIRQAPPKLKSRRVSRNSRRRKLRHGVKPRRRA